MQCRTVQYSTVQQYNFTWGRHGMSDIRLRGSYISIYLTLGKKPYICYSTVHYSTVGWCVLWFGWERGRRPEETGLPEMYTTQRKREIPERMKRRCTRPHLPARRRLTLSFFGPRWRCFVMLRERKKTSILFGDMIVRSVSVAQLSGLVQVDGLLACDVSTPRVGVNAIWSGPIFGLDVCNLLMPSVAFVSILCPFLRFLLRLHIFCRSFSYERERNTGSSPHTEDSMSGKVSHRKRQAGNIYVCVCFLCLFLVYYSVWHIFVSVLFCGI